MRKFSKEEKKFFYKELVKSLVGLLGLSVFFTAYLIFGFCF